MEGSQQADGGGCHGPVLHMIKSQRAKPLMQVRALTPRRVNQGLRADLDSTFNFVTLHFYSAPKEWRIIVSVRFEALSLDLQ